ncbi:non-homologous end-joining DNA ligase [Microbacterium invictum]|uniref:Non-homologous end-joining DNA ligase n=1 Tax=Microbacterium invictum TaxID=515415 RepID=A0ABZ0V9Y3_9MICO|nr:non-homologous end-joining DNA ligase [Microbacterium invictum]WQB69617.1 non-homologous end-joining DNA ligase [Microbacterium invictum]
MASPFTMLTVPGPAGEREVRLSNPDRVLWPALGITKRELAEYLMSVSGPFLAANGDRPVSLERFPESVEGERFYSKNPPKGTPDYVEAVTVRYNSGRRHPQIVLTEPAAVVWAAQMNTIVFHPWASLTSNTDNPVELRIDLDPQPGTDFADAAAVAPALREVLSDAGLTAYLKTSGNRGIHVFCPIQSEWEFLDVRHAVIAAGRELERRMPDRVTTNWWKEERGERIFIDFNQANRDRTMAGAYSPRALAGATVSTPITWDELADADPSAFTVRSVPERLASVGDPWEGMPATPGRIDVLLEWWQRDLDDGLGELPFPPDFPKMPGEPPRVQPSRKNEANWPQD